MPETRGGCQPCCELDRGYARVGSSARTGRSGIKPFHCFGSVSQPGWLVVAAAVVVVGAMIEKWKKRSCSLSEVALKMWAVFDESDGYC